MDTSTKIVAPCGISCFNCEVYSGNITKETQDRLSELIKIPAEKISCNGCAGGDLCVFLKLRGKSCKTLDCVNEHKVAYCHECPDFPCRLLMPVAQGAEKYPHNLKVYNLCLIKKLGLQKWLDQAVDIKYTYFHTNFEIGKGGCDD